MASASDFLGFQALTAQRHGILIAFPADQVGRTLTLPVSEPIPGSVAWLAGVGRLGDHLLWVFDVAPAGEAAGPYTVVVAPGSTPGWGVRVDRVESLIEARRTGPSRPGQTPWPSAWAGGCLLADGRRALLIDLPRIIAAISNRPEAA